MTNRWIRFLLAVLAIAAASAAAYRVVVNEQQLAREAVALRDATLAADAALSSVEELKAALHAYVAPGQGADFWTSRARLLLDKVRSGLLALDAPAAASGASLGEVLDACDRLAAAEQRAAGYVRNAQPLLAGEVIFTEGRDLIDAIRIQIARSRDRIGNTAAQRQFSLRRQQIYLLGGGAGVLALVMLLLVPGARAASAVVTEPTGDERPAPPPAVPATAPPPAIDSETLAAICSDLARIADSREIAPLLERIQQLLQARGVIVWLHDAETGQLQAAVASGYDERVMARIGTIGAADDNLTADAYRGNVVRSSPASAHTPAAFAVPLPAPDGPAGVLSAELTPDAVMDAAKLDVARVVAAQLGAVLGSTAPRSPDAADDPSAAAPAQSSP